MLDWVLTSLRAQSAHVCTRNLLYKKQTRLYKEPIVQETNPTLPYPSVELALCGLQHCASLR